MTLDDDEIRATKVNFFLNFIYSCNRFFVCLNKKKFALERANYKHAHSKTKHYESVYPIPFVVFKVEFLPARKNALELGFPVESEIFRIVSAEGQDFPKRTSFQSFHDFIVELTLALSHRSCNILTSILSIVSVRTVQNSKDRPRDVFNPIVAFQGFSRRYPRHALPS